VYTIGEDLGSRPGGPAGTNLLHSFELFDLGSGDTALFTADPTRITRNVIARVTGGVGPSQIFGTLRSDIDGADLYFLNPRGIIFGPDAGLDLRGSFFASSADSVRLFDVDGNSYEAFSNDAPLLEATPRDFGFVGSPATIEMQGSQLAVPSGEAIGLIGGDLLIHGRGGDDSLGYLDTSGGRIDLASLGGPGTVQRIVAPEPALILNGEGGDIRIDSGAIVNASGIQPSVFCDFCGVGSTGRGAGDVFVRGHDLVIENAEIRAMTASASPAGDVDVALTGDLTIRQTGDLAAGIFAGSGLDQVLLENSPPPTTVTWVPFDDEFFLGTRIRTQTAQVQQPDGSFTTVPVAVQYITEGPSGDVSVSAENVSLEGGARISTTSFFGGDPGTITIDAGATVSITGADASGSQSALFSNGQGDSGAGAVEIRAEELRLDRGIIVTEARNTAGSPSGDGGAIDIDVARLLLTNNARIDSSTRGAGDGGKVTVDASEWVRLSGGDEEVPGVEREFSGITAIAQDIDGGAAPGQIGMGGSVEITTPWLILENGAEISARADETSLGGGSVDITGNRVELSGGSLIATSSEGDAPAGDVILRTSGLLHIVDSTVSASVSGGAGGGGNIDIVSDTLVLDAGRILTTGAQGPGGDINISAEVLFASPDSLVSARSEENVDGQVVIVSPVVAVDEGVARPKVQFLDPSALLRNTCAARAGRAPAGRFQVTREGIPLTPDRVLLAFQSLEGGGALAGQPVDRPDGVAAASEGPFEIAQVSFTRGAGAFQAGRFEEAAEELARSSEQYAAAGDPAQQSDALRAMAESQQAAGRYADSLIPLSEALSYAEASGDRGRMAAARGSLGNAYLALGRSQEAGEQLERAVEIARGLGEPALTARLLVNLGNLRTVAGESQEALARYDESVALARGAKLPREEAIALSNAARSVLATDRPDRAEDLIDAAELATRDLPPTHEKVVLWLSLAALHRNLGGPERLLAAHEDLSRATALADRLDDQRALSLGLGYLGDLYAAEYRWEEALLLTRRALRVAEETHAPDLLYRWHAQEGRLLWARGRAMQAQRSYRRAIAIIEELRPESRAQYGSAAAEFRRVVAPVYLDFVDSLLQGSGLVSDPADAERLLQEARATMEQLKAAELRDYFRDECVAQIASRTIDLDRVSRDSRAAVVYPILLADRIELLVSLPAGLRRYTVAVPIDEIAKEIEAYRDGLMRRTSRRYLRPARRLYDWLVRPYAAQLETEGVKTLVFVPDGPLRQVPMSALDDGEAPLVHHYALAVTPGLSLVDPRPLDLRDGRFLLAGLSRPVQGFDALPNTTREIEAIQGLYGGDILLNEDFESSRFEGRLEAEIPSVVHVASHAVFTGDPATSFVLTYDDRLTMDQLSEVVAPTQFRQRPLELLTLSACETAAGDERAALGLAGVAIRAGARSALGSLWAVQDEATYRMMVEFYAGLKEPGVSRAEALRRAQLAVMEDRSFSHPFYWSAFLLISNWL
jgi:filamentous hemagglutinin family protein